MDGDPIDPVTFHGAREELVERLAAHEGIDLTQHYRGDDAEGSHEARSRWHQTEQKLGDLRSHATLKLQGLMIVERLRTWTYRSHEWRRVSQEELKAWMMNSGDDGPRFYLDRKELSFVPAETDSWRMGRHAGQTSSDLPSGAPKKRGRPRGRGGYGRADEPHMSEMHSLLTSGEAKSVTKAAEIVVQRGKLEGGREVEGGGTDESKATRLRKRYIRWIAGE